MPIYQSLNYFGTVIVIYIIPMSTSYHTDTRKSSRHKTIIVIIGVLVALMIGFGVSASGVDQPQVEELNVSNQTISWAISHLGQAISGTFDIFKITILKYL